MRKLSTSEFIEKSIVVHGSLYSYTNTNYVNAVTKVIITCSVHGDFLQRPNDHISGKNGCPKCKGQKIGNDKRKNVSELIKQFKSMHGDTYDYSSVIYVNGQSAIKLMCKSHGEFFISANKHRIGRGCPKCGVSNGERMIIEVLESLSIIYEQQKTFSELRGDKRLLKYDFYLPDYNILLEFDGEFHFFHNKCFDYKNITESEAIDKFLKTKEYDCIKNTFAQKNKIYLLRIPYTVTSILTIKKYIIDFIAYTSFDLPSIDESFNYVEMQVPKRPKS